MLPQMLHKPADALLLGRQQRLILAFEKLRKHLQVVQIGLTTQRPQPALHPQMRQILTQHRPTVSRIRRR